MRLINKIFLILVLSALFIPVLLSAQEKTVIYFFESESCPHCAAEKIFLEKLQKQDPNIEVRQFEITKNESNRLLLKKLGEELSIQTSYVPITFIGNNYFVGYQNEESHKKLIKDLIEKQRRENTPDIVAPIINKYQKEQTANNPTKTSMPEKINLPFLGEINIKKLSLPALTVIFGTLDGFNPCSMWALVFLIGLLISMKNKRRLVILGTVFVVVSAASYFLFMSAWLNLFLFLGFIFWIRIIIGLIALGSGAYNIREFFVNKNAACKVSNTKTTQKFTQKLRESVNSRNLILAVLGITALAFSVNLVELICSAGFPAIYTQVLALSHLPTWQYYAYLLLYVFFYDLDEIIVLIVAVWTFKITATSSRFTRWSQIIGGALMLILGLLLLFKPSWLMFS